MEVDINGRARISRYPPGNRNDDAATEQLQGMAMGTRHFFTLGSAAAAALLATAPGNAPRSARAVTVRRPRLSRPDGAELVVKDWGSGPPVLFAQSVGVNSDMWSHPMAHLVWQGFRCLSFDRSTALLHQEQDAPAGDLGSVLDSLDLRDVTLVGHALGCDGVVRYLRQQGESRVRQVALISPVADFRAELSGLRVPARIVSGIARLDEELTQYCSA
jgi:hypothetical protein